MTFVIENKFKRYKFQKWSARMRGRHIRMRIAENANREIRRYTREFLRISSIAREKWWCERGFNGRAAAAAAPRARQSLLYLDAPSFLHHFLYAEQSVPVNTRGVREVLSPRFLRATARFRETSVITALLHIGNLSLFIARIADDILVFESGRRYIIRSQVNIN